MPLSSPAQRAPLHTRRIECRGYRRDDGLWDIEGHLVDTKTYPFDNNWRGAVAAGTHIHDMWIRLTVDDALVVQGIEAVTDASPYTICPSITPNFQRVVGLSIKTGWTQQVRTLLGGVEGCTHLVELLGPVATTAYQTIIPWQSKLRREAGIAPRRPGHLDSCHALRTDGPVVEEFWPAYYAGAPTGRT